MAGATRPICAWCEAEARHIGHMNERPPNYRQELTLRTVNGERVWLHLQCVFGYQHKDD